MISSDNHLGYKDKHPIIGEDSYNAFEEVLRTAKEQKVDFVILGGDLFMDATPSINCLYKTTNLLSKYIYGSG